MTAAERADRMAARTRRAVIEAGERVPARLGMTLPLAEYDRTTRLARG